LIYVVKGPEVMHSWVFYSLAREKLVGWGNESQLFSVVTMKLK